MQKYTGQNLQDTAGNARAGVRVLVKRADTGADATIYQDDESTVITQDASFQTNADGELPTFKAPNGLYNITFPDSPADDFGPVTLLDPTDAASIVQAAFEYYEAQRIRLTRSNVVGVATTDHPFQLGPDDGPNLRMSPDRIQAVDDGVANTLRLQSAGGNCIIGSAGAGQQRVIFRTSETNAEIQAQDAGSDSPLELNPDGSLVYVRDGLDVTGGLTVDGTAVSAIAVTSGQFNLTMLGGTVSPTARVDWQRVGDRVTFQVAAAIITSNANTWESTAGDIPAALRPTVSTYAGLCVCTVGSDLRPGVVQIQSDGTLAIAVYDSAADDMPLSGWPSSGSKGHQRFTCTYLAELPI